MKNFTWTLALCALALASCSKEKASMEISKNQDLNQVNFALNTSRATVSNLTTMQDNPTGFVIYGSTPASTTAWYAGVDGTNNYKYTGGAWGWATGAPQWPADGGYPMNFFAYFPAAAPGLTLTSPTPAAATGTYVIQPEATQIDLLAAKTQVAEKPLLGVVPLVFNHTLSKINFGIIPGNTMIVCLQSLNVNNVGNTRQYNFLTASWAAQPTAFASNYIYKATANPATEIIGVDATEVAVHGTAATNLNLMLMPQTAPSWVPTRNVAPANSYMSLIYRMQSATDANAIGFLEANAHPSYSTLSPADQATYNGQPLFVKVGYPFNPTNLTWDKGLGYTYNIKIGTLGASNGYLLDTVYYDADGNPTPLIVDGKPIGEPISSGRIDFTVTVTPWADSTPNVIQ